MKSQDQDFTIESIKLKQGGCDLFAILDVGHSVEWAGLVVGDLKGQRTVVFAAGFKELIEAGHGALAALVDDEIACDGEKPCLKSRFAVELGTAGENAHPDFLEQIFGLLAVSSKEQEVTKKAMLEAHNELVQEAGVLTLKSFSDSKILLPYLFISRGESSWCKERANGRNRTHLVPLDDKWLPSAAEKMSFHQKYSDLPVRRQGEAAAGDDSD